MDLSRRDAFRPCSRDSSGDKVNFVLLAKKKKTFLIGIGPPYLSRLYLSSCAFRLQLFASYGHSKTFRLQLTDLHYPVGY